MSLDRSSPDQITLVCPVDASLGVLVVVQNGVNITRRTEGHCGCGTTFCRKNVISSSPCM